MKKFLNEWFTYKPYCIDYLLNPYNTYFIYNNIYSETVTNFTVLYENEVYVILVVRTIFNIRALRYIKFFNKEERVLYVNGRIVGMLKPEELPLTRMKEWQLKLNY